MQGQTMKNNPPRLAPDGAQHQGHTLIVAGIDLTQLERELEETIQNDCDRAPDEVAIDALAVIRTVLAPATDTDIPVSPGHDQHQLALRRDATDAAARAGGRRQLGLSTTPGSASSPSRVSFANPITHPGELYAGICQDPDLGALHLILLPGDVRVGSIEDAEDFVASLGGELPTYAELDHLYKCMRQQFKPSLYYTCEQEDCDGDVGTMLYDFATGRDREAQSGVRYIRARAVRRVLAAVGPEHLGTSTQIVDTLPGQKQGGVVQGNDTSPRAGTQVDGARARALQEAIALLVDANTRLFRSNDCRHEFLNGMAHGFATYASASNALALAPAPEHAERSFSITSWSQRFGVPPLADQLDDPRKRAAAISAALYELYAAVSSEYASIVLETWEAGGDQEDLSKLAAGDAAQRKDGHALG
jgi:hypothetical protein